MKDGIFFWIILCVAIFFMAVEYINFASLIKSLHRSYVEDGIFALIMATAGCLLPPGIFTLIIVNKIRGKW
jgi:hypothetical protein